MTDFSGKIGNSNAFSAQKTGDLQKNKKKGLLPILRRIFRAKSEIQTLFRPKKQVITKPNKKKKRKKQRSSPKLRRIFRPEADIQTLFQAVSRHLLHNFGTQFCLEGGLVFIFLPKIGLKSTKNVRFCILHRPMGELEPPSPPGYATVCA